ncbi:MAG: hypothetical protein A2W99_07540 [Bacteroidetes bacterium GWF2_33_16]|nr:MAG: hypothetical protein A2X00_10490 [Bacteroidetes bacterium GWE2_32_14]OFY03061.1 MAG: hypothetical protein A2W99_07540 [Bacteroidetes bacterium GWF2_33_16]
MVFLLATLFYLTKNGNRRVNIILSVLILLFGFQIIYSFALSAFGYIYFINGHKILYLIRQTSLLIGPIIYLYLHAFLRNRKIKSDDLLHAIPFLGMLLFLGIYFNKLNHFIIWEVRLDLYNTILILIHNLIYIILSILYLKKIHYSIKGLFKNLKTSSPIGWLQFLLLGFIILWIINLNSFAIYMYVKQPGWCAYNASMYALTSFSFLISIMFFLVLKPDIYFYINKYRNSSINNSVKKKYVQSLIAYMEIKSPYLEPEISIEKVANDLSINSRTLSQIINESFKNNFNGYMNEFRLKESMRQLSDTNNRKTILEILYNSGFNSKSVFYAEFKKRTGLTPQEYRARYTSKSMVN